jgi:hypothetical protein
MSVRFGTVADYFNALHAAASDPSTGFTFPTLSASAFQDGYNDFQYGWPHPIGGVYNVNGQGTIQYQVRASVCVSVCVRARERVCASVCVRACVCERVCASV